MKLKNIFTFIFIFIPIQSFAGECKDLLIGRIAEQVLEIQNHIREVREQGDGQVTLIQHTAANQIAKARGKILQHAGGQIIKIQDRVERAAAAAQGRIEDLKQEIEQINEELRSAQNEIGFHPLLDLKLDALNFDTHTKNAFKEMEFTYVGDVIPYSQADLLSLDNFGKSSLDEVLKTFSILDLHLEMETGNWLPPSSSTREPSPVNSAVDYTAEDGAAVQRGHTAGNSGEPLQTAEIKTENHGRAPEAPVNVDNAASSGRSLIRISSLVFFTPEFKKWLEKKGNLHPESQSKLMNTINRFEGVSRIEEFELIGWSNWINLKEGLYKLVISSKSLVEIRVYFTIQDEKIYVLFGEKATGRRSMNNHNVDLARQILQRYFAG